MTRSFIGIGANLGDREATLRSAIESLDAIAGIEVVAVSTLRETDPVGFVTDQPRFLKLYGEQVLPRLRKRFG